MSKEKVVIFSDEWTALNPLKTAASAAVALVLGIAAVIGGCGLVVWSLFAFLPVLFAVPLLVMVVAAIFITIGIYGSIMEDKEIQARRALHQKNREKEKQARLERLAKIEAEKKERAQWEIPK